MLETGEEGDGLPDIRIFLSSTFEDLVEIRSRIREHLSVIPAEIVTMELFGSDETQPIQYCIEGLRTCNFFIGIYAERYGTTEPKSHMSITEIEYLEAAALLRSGRLDAILLYILDPKAKWPVNLIDRDHDKVAALAELKRKIKAEHTVTFFEDPEKLSLDLLRDVLRKIGIPPKSALKPRLPGVTPTYDTARVVGMEHYTERDSIHFHGREHAVSKLASLVAEHPITLFIGDSGVGKTSLLHAGLVPTLKKLGWAVAITRPLDHPDIKIAESLWHQLMDVSFNPTHSLPDTLGLVSIAHDTRSILIAIDQFEDAILTLNEPLTAQLRSALARAYNTPLPNVKLLIAYRGDADAKVGPYWQELSGSPNGLPRYYLQPLSSQAAKCVLVECFADRTEEKAPLLSRLTAELADESLTLDICGIYPPFLQMLADTLVKQADSTSSKISEQLYTALGGAHEIIGRYLVNQLRYLGDQEHEARRLLPELVSKTGRSRKSAEQLANATNLPISNVHSLLQHLSALRVVRTQDGLWEIVHDFLARRIWEEFSNPDEQDARVFGDLLTAKSATFPSTGELLTARESSWGYMCIGSELDALLTKSN